MKVLLQYCLIFLCFISANALAAARTPVTLHAARGDAIIQAALATTPHEQEQGLMFRTHLPAQEGMLFVFEPPQAVTMWMKNTLISLDMIFIGPGGTVLRIEPRAVPKSETIISSGGVVAAVLEVAGGTAEKIGLKAGDRVEYEAH